MIHRSGKISVKNPLATRLGAMAAAFMLVLATDGCMPLSTVTSLAVDAGYTASEARTADEVVDDNALQIKISQAMFDADIDLFKNVSTIVYRGRVLLLGSVARRAARKRAEKLATRVAGSREIINDIQVSEGGGVTGFVNDILIEKTIQSALLLHDHIRSSNYRVRSVNGVVYLIGVAEDRAELDRVLAEVRRTEGVARVVNHMRFNKPTS